ncbi:MAG: carbohydrate kinase family protein, partial [Chloroflexota bacterium]
LEVEIFDQTIPAEVVKTVLFDSIGEKLRAGEVYMNNSIPRKSVQVVGFGMLTPVAILVVEKLPEHNTGALIKEISEFIFDDAAIVACLLRQWGIRTGIIGTAVGDDDRGHALNNQLKNWDVQSKVRFSREFKTPLEVDVSDETGARTYFWQREEKVLATLDDADLSMLDQAELLYVDWYDGDHILRAMDKATRLKLPVFLNFEFGHSNPDLLNKFAGHATICQAVTDAAQKDDSNSLEVAQKLIHTGVQTALITLAGEGSLVVQRDHILRIRAPKVKAVDGCGAGATYSAGFIFATLNNWSLEKSARFATAAASLKVTRPGLEMYPVEEILAFGEQVLVEDLSAIH